MENDKPKTMMELFPAEQLKRMILHIDRYDTEVVDDEDLKIEKLNNEVEKVSDEIIEQNL
jgi:hypothetical protein